MAIASRKILHVFAEAAAADAHLEPRLAKPAVAPGETLGSASPATTNSRNPFTSDPSPALSWSVRHFGVAGLVGGALGSALLRILRRFRP